MLDRHTFNAFAGTIDSLESKVKMLFMTPAMPRALQAHGVLTLGKQADGLDAREVHQAVSLSNVGEE